MARRKRRRSSLLDPEVATLKGLEAMGQIATLAAQISEEAEVVLQRAADVEERAVALEAAIEMNFWVQLRLSRTRELDAVEEAASDSADVAYEISKRISELRAEFFACVAISDFLAGLGSRSSAQDEDEV